MKQLTLGLTLIAAALLSGCIVVPARPYRSQVTVVGDYDRGDYGRGGYDRGGYDRRDRDRGRDRRDYGPPPAPGRGW